ncbi:MAG TPA: hypothetical protein VGI06_12765 [Acidimicrobiales bacterium]
MTPFTHRSGEGGWGAARADLATGATGATGAELAGSGDRKRHEGLGWAVQRLAGGAAEIHAAAVPTPARRLLRWCEPDRPALVLGSAQPDADVDAEGAVAAGLEVVRRRSGGSAVVVGPGRLVWADVIVPAGDPLWSDDVGVAPMWLGRCWARALDALGLTGAVVHEGAMVRGPWSPLVCFAGTGPGEVLIGGRKIVGISQRRTREAALFQVAVLLAWDPVETTAGLVIDPRAADELAGAAVGIDEVVPTHGRIEDAFAVALAAATRT